MEQTPKVNKKILSLGNKKNNKRHSGSPKRSLRSAPQNGFLTNGYNMSAVKEPPRSPSVVSISSDNGIECTPPHRRLNLDDSIDYSPKNFDSSFSPSNLLSQTLAIDSPEVGWRWARRSSGANDNESMTTPDSAYAADSSYSSATESFGKDRELGIRKKSETAHWLNNDFKREDYRKTYEIEMRKAEKTKADELLKKRCAKLQEQLKEAELRSKCDKEKKAASVINEKKKATSSSRNDIGQNKPQLLEKENKPNTSSRVSEPKSKITSPRKSKETAKQDNFDDFFNDSDIDCFLLEATQQCESKMIHSTQTESSDNQKPCKTLKNEMSTPPSTPRPTPSKEKRTSLYMQFLEDDFNDDWFATLDEEVIKATQAKKPRTSLQRYKSLPSDASPSNNKQVPSYSSKKDVEGTPKFKRHNSSHAISPSTANYQGRQRKH